MAVDMEFGGYDSSTKYIQFQESLVDYFDREGKNIEVEDLEDILLQVMSEEFSTILEDESEREISKNIWNLYQECIRGKTDLLNKLRILSQKPLPVQIIKPEDDQDSDENITEEDMDQEMVDEDSDNEMN